MSYIYLQDRLPINYALALCIPLGLIVFNLLYYLLWIGTYLINRIIDVGKVKFNIIFSLTTLNLFGYISIPSKEYLDVYAFCLAFLILLSCYTSTMIALKMVLTNILLHTTSFTHKNLWKVALTVLCEFIMELTMFCYIGSRHFPDAYNTTITIFDAFTFVVITFGTTGYGDIVPHLCLQQICFYSRHRNEHCLHQYHVKQLSLCLFAVKKINHCKKTPVWFCLYQTKTFIFFLLTY